MRGCLLRRAYSMIFDIVAEGLQKVLLLSAVGLLLC